MTFSWSCIMVRAKMGNNINNMDDANMSSIWLQGQKKLVKTAKKEYEKKLNGRILLVF